MTVPNIKAIGFCAHYSPQGDWAFNYALELSKKYSLQLNVFHFLADPYDPTANSWKSLPKEKIEEIAIEKERELRTYYDGLAGDYLNVGFRLCYDESWRELHRCLLIKEFQLLVLGYLTPTAIFAGKEIRGFADSFVSPVVLVGPDSPDEYWLNSRAVLLADKLGLENKNWSCIERGHYPKVPDLTGVDSDRRH